MNKPLKDAPWAEQMAYRRWVRAQLAVDFRPTTNGVLGEDERRAAELLDTYDQIRSRPAGDEEEAPESRADRWVDAGQRKPEDGLVHMDLSYHGDSRGHN